MKKNMENRGYAKAAFFLLLLVVFLCGCTRKQAEITDMEELFFEESEDVSEEEKSEPEKKPESGEERALAETEQVQTYYVHVCGAVKAPGVYPVMAGKRIFEALEAAGGFAEDACVDYVNQAAFLSDGMRLWIPSRKEAEEMGWKHPDAKEMSGSETAFSNHAGSALVNINTASEEMLCTLRGIGQSKAQAILAYREAHGAFSKKEDIMQVAGIKQSGYEKIKDHICVGWE